MSPQPRILSPSRYCVPSTSYVVDISRVAVADSWCHKVRQEQSPATLPLNISLSGPATLGSQHAAAQNVPLSSSGISSLQSSTEGVDGALQTPEFDPAIDLSDDGSGSTVSSTSGWAFGVVGRACSCYDFWRPLLGPLVLEPRNRRFNASPSL